MTEYITDSGDYGDVDLKGDGTGITQENDRDVPLMINAPGKNVIIDTLTISDCWLPFQVRDVNSLIINKVIVSDFMNDGGHFCCGDITINSATVNCDVVKRYSDKNHPDVFQIFPWQKCQPLGDLIIRKLNVFLRGSPEHAGIHLTENCDYNNIYIGTDGINYDTDADYPYWFSANSLRDSIIGHGDMNVSGKSIRIKDVKRTGKPISGVYLLGEQGVVCADEHVGTHIIGMG